MKGCKNCEKRGKCKKLCKEAEKYSNQDYIGINHVEYITMQEADSIPDQNWPKGLSTIEAIILYRFANFLKPKDIAKKLNISRQYVSKVIKKYRASAIKKIKKSVALRLNNKQRI